MQYMIHSMRILLRSATQYRASFIMQVISQLVMTGGDLLAVLVLMGRFSGVGQWQPDEILFFFGVMQVSFALCECFGRGISVFSWYIGQGEFDAMILRPKPLLLQVICNRMDPRRLGCIIVGVAALAASSLKLSIVWTFGKALLLLFACLGSIFLLLGLFLIEATISFFSIRSIEAVNVLTFGGKTTCQYPVDIYPKPLKLLFTWVAPFALCMHLPVSHILGKPLTDGPAALAYLAPMVGPVFFTMMALVWRKLGVKHYRSTGT